MLVLKHAATLAACLNIPGAVRINRIRTGWLTKLFKGSRKFIFIDLSLACGFHSVMGCPWAFRLRFHLIVTNDAG